MTLQFSLQFLLYSVNNITSGSDSQGEVTVRLAKDGFATTDLDVPLGANFDKTVRLERPKTKGPSHAAAPTLLKKANAAHATAVASGHAAPAAPSTSPPPAAATAPSPAAPSKPKIEKW